MSIIFKIHSWLSDENVMMSSIRLSSVKRSPFIYQKGSRISILVPLSWPNPCGIIFENEASMLKTCQILESGIAIKVPSSDISLYHFSTKESFVIIMPVRLWEMAQDTIIPLRTSRGSGRSFLYLIMTLCRCIARSSYVKVQSMHSLLVIEA